MSNVKHAVSVAAVALTTVFLAASCKTSQPPSHSQGEADSFDYSRPAYGIYGEPGSNKIRVVIGGSSANNRGMYFFTNGISLQTALAISDNLEKNQFAVKLTYFHWNADHYEKRNFRNYREMKVTEREEIALHDLDKIDFPCSLP